MNEGSQRKAVQSGTGLCHVLWRRSRLNTEFVALGIIILIGLFLRCYHLGYQSLWLDELYTAIESDPAIREHGLNYYLTNVDQQPPLLFLLERLAIGLCHNNEWALRIVPAMAGTGGIWAIYLLGCELKNIRLGLFSAAFLSINYFSIYYSQEARPYSLVLFFSILSMLFFLRGIKNPSLKNWLWYALLTLLMLYTNYFGALVCFVQLILIILIIYKERLYDRKFLFLLLLAGLMVVLGVLPLLRYVSGLTKISQFWAELPGEHIPIDYFFVFFGNSDLLSPILSLLLISFFAQLFGSNTIENGKIWERQQTYLFIVCSIWIVTCLLFPFFRSYLVMPMMVERYSISILPAFILILASGLEIIRADNVRYILFTLYALLSLSSLVMVKQYYTKINKTQFREVAAYMASDTSMMFPVLTRNTAWQQTYYLKKFHYRSPVYNYSYSNPGLDSFLRKSDSRKGFWIVMIHPSGNSEKENPLFQDSLYTLLKQEQFFDCEAALFIQKDYFGPGSIRILPSDLPESKRFHSEGKDLIPLWDGEPISMPDKKLRAGTYQMLLVSRGTPLAGVFPHVQCEVNGTSIGAYSLNLHETLQRFTFNISRDTMVSMQFRMDNDSNSLATHEDRNAFIQTILLVPENPLN